MLKTLTITLDWLAGTVKEQNNETAGFMLWLGMDNDCERLAATNGYAEAARTPYGAIVSWNTNRSDMGTHVVLSGSTLRTIQERTGIGPQEMLRRMCNAGFNISRLDLAKDLVNVPIDYGAIWRDIQQKAYTGTARTFNRIEGATDGVTIYIGSRTSERFLRLYDKAAQTGEKDTPWARLELECKGMSARAMASFLAQEQTWACAFDGQVSEMVNLTNNKDWSLFFNVDDVPIGLPKMEHKSDREKWIDEQVISAVVDHFVKNPDSDAIKRLRQTLDLIDEMNKGRVN